MTDMQRYEQTHDQKLLSDIHVAALVKVKSFDKSKMTVEVQPLAKSLEGGKYTSQPPILSVPVAVTKIGGFIIRPWIKAGDIGVVVYPDHDMDSALAGGKETEPNTQRNHSPSDAVFIGGVVSGSYTVPGSIPDEALVLATEDGSKYIALKKDGIEIKGDVTIKGDVNTTGKIVAEKDVLAEKTKSGAHHTHRGDSGGTTGQPQ